MLRQMRDKKVISVIIGATILAFVGLMVFSWGMDMTGRSSAQASGGELGRVNGEPITYEEWNGTYRNLVDQQQRENPGQPLSAAVSRQIEETAWEQIITQKLISQELRRRGIEVTDAEVRQAARFAPPPEFMNNPAFLTNGQFDINKYHAFLSSPSVDNQLLMQLEAYYRDLIPRSKLFYQVTSGTYMPDSELWRIWRDARETATVKYVTINPDAVVPDAAVSVTPREIERYYDENQEDFRRPATARVRYVSINRAPEASDSAAALQRVQRVRQAAIANFEETARTESADSVSRARDGNLGKLRRGMTVPVFEQAAFSQPVGVVGEPVLSQFGWHIIKVNSRTEDEADVSHILIPIERSEASAERMLVWADSLEALGEQLPLAQVAQRMGLRVRDGEINDDAPFLAAVGQADDAALWAFREAEEAGEVSPVFETPSAFYMVELVSKTEEGIPSLKDATPEIERILKLEKKIEQAKTNARTILDRVRGGQTLEQAAMQSRLGVQTAGPFTRLEFVPGLGRANAAIGAAFGLKPGQISDVVEAENTLFIIQSVARTEADKAEWEAQKAEQRERTTPALAEQRWNQFLIALRESAEITDNRAVLQQQQAQQPAFPTAPF